jgi:hypothetical protein
MRRFESSRPSQAVRPENRPVTRRRAARRFGRDRAYRTIANGPGIFQSDRPRSQRHRRRRYRCCEEVRRASSFIFQIEDESLAVDHFPVLRDRDVDAGAAFGIHQLDGLGHGVWIFPPCSMVSKRRPLPSMAGSCGRFSGESWANRCVSFMLCPLKLAAASWRDFALRIEGVLHAAV